LGVFECIGVVPLGLLCSMCTGCTARYAGPFPTVCKGRGGQ